MYLLLFIIAFYHDAIVIFQEGDIQVPRNWSSILFVVHRFENDFLPKNIHVHFDNILLQFKMNRKIKIYVQCLYVNTRKTCLLWFWPQNFARRSIDFRIVKSHKKGWWLKEKIWNSLQKLFFGGLWNLVPNLCGGFWNSCHYDDISLCKYYLKEPPISKSSTHIWHHIHNPLNTC